MKKFLCIISLLLICIGSNAYASLVNDVVSLGSVFNSGPPTTYYGGGVTTTVTNDNSDIARPHWPYTVDVNEDSFYVDYDYENPAYSGNSYLWSSDTALHVYDLNDSIGDVLINVIVETNMDGWTDDRLSFGDDIVRLNWGGLRFNEDVYFDVSMTFGASPVPIPGTISLLGLGLLGLAGVSRRKK